MLKRLWRETRGASAVEFAMLAPALFLMVFGLYDFGRLFWIQNALEFATEQAGRYAIANYSATTSSIQSNCNTALSGLTGLSVCSVSQTTISSGSPYNVSTTYNVITANYTFNFAVCCAPGLFPSIALAAKAQVPHL